MANAFTHRGRQLRAVARKAVRHRARIRRAAAARLAARAGTVGTRGLLSVVIPAYNVEQYLAECLDSVLAQTHWKVEAIVIVDGATDNTRGIAERYAARDRRVTVHWQENAGLSAARNAGAALARGEYLWFVDSDDLIEPDAAAAMIRSLRATGSDFAVGTYRRFNSRRSRQPGSWIRAAHAAPRHHIQLADNTDILVNAVAWSKVYRRRFWVENQFSFPVGKHYEDQPVSARAYAIAAAFDVLPDVIYRWRERDDNSSISQQTHRVDDLRARLESFDLALAELDPRHPAAGIERRIQYLANDLQFSIRRLDQAPPEFWQTLADGIAALAEPIPLDRWRDIPTEHAALEWLLRHHDFERARHYVEQGGLELATLASATIDGTPVLQVPFWDDPDVAYPLPVLALADRHLKPDAQLLRAHWHTPSALRLEGWAHPRLVAPAHTDGPLTAELVAEQDPEHRVPLPLEHTTNPDIDRLSNHHIHDFRDTAWACTIDPDALNLQPGTTYRIRFTARIAGRDHHADLTTVDRRGSAAALPTGATAHGLAAALRIERDQPIRLDIARAATITAVETHDGETTLHIAGSEKRRLRLHITPLNNEGGPLVDHRRTIPTRRDSTGHGHIARITAATLAALGPHGATMQATIDGKPALLLWADPPATPQPLNTHKKPHYLYTDHRGTPHVSTKPPAVIVTDLHTTAETVRIRAALHPAHRAEQLQAVIADHRFRIAGRISHTAETPAENAGGWTQLHIDIPFDMDRWGRRTPLPGGRYRLDITDGNKPLTAQLRPAVIAALPMPLDPAAPITGRIGLTGRAAPTLQLHVDPTLAADERGARQQKLLRDDHRTGHHPLDENAVLFRTYYGESATDSALGVHRELVRRGTDLQLYWAVKDSSVPVPEGGQPVVIGSREWYRLLSEAKYLFDNVHQVPYFTKRPGQIFVQTLHGYPFKIAGLRYWESAGYGPARIASFLHRHQQWDYLISPAPYATPLLQQDFPTSATILEIGYPRNDIYFADERHDLRSRTRRVLGIDDDTTAILYAPTYRDNLSRDEFRSDMVDFLDFPRIRKALQNHGQKTVILVRGHMMNARTDRRQAAQDGVIDVTDYPEISELALASDAAILDYSSLRFDYALTGKPMIFHIPDLEQYRDDARGWMLPYETTAPGPFTRTNDDVIEALANLPGILQRHAADRENFIADYLPLEDGKAAARLIDTVFHQHHAPPEPRGHSPANPAGAPPPPQEPAS